MMLQKKAVSQHTELEHWSFPIRGYHVATEGEEQVPWGLSSEHTVFHHRIHIIQGLWALIFKECLDLDPSKMKIEILSLSDIYEAHFSPITVWTEVPLGTSSKWT